MASQQETLLIILKARDDLSKAMKSAGVKSVKELKKLAAGLKAVDALQKRAGRGSQKTGRLMVKAWKAATKSVLGFTRAFLPMFAAITSAQAAGATLSAVFRRVGAAMRVSVISAAAFSIAMSEISTILPNAQAQMVGLARSVKDTSVELNKPALDVAKGLYQAISAGFSDARDAMLLLNQAAKLGTAGLADTADTIDLLTTTVNAYRKDVSEAAAISDVFFETVRLGKTTISELSADVGKALPLAASLGITIEEVAAGMATLTQEGFNTGEAMTAMRALFKALLRQVGQLNLVFAKTGQEYTLQTIRANGLSKTLKILRESVDDDSEAMLVLGGRVEAAGALFGLTGKNLKPFQKILKGIQNSAGATDKALAKMLLNDAFFLQQSFNALKVESLAFGQAVIDGAAQALRAYGGIEAVQRKLRAAFEGMAPVVERISGQIAEWALSFTDAGASAELMTARFEVAFNRLGGQVGSIFNAVFNTALEDSDDLVERLRAVTSDDFSLGSLDLEGESAKFDELYARLNKLNRDFIEQQKEDGLGISTLRNTLSALGAPSLKQRDFDRETLSIKREFTAEAQRKLKIELGYNDVLRARRDLNKQEVIDAEATLKLREVISAEAEKARAGRQQKFDLDTKGFSPEELANAKDVGDAAMEVAAKFTDGFVLGIIRSRGEIDDAIASTLKGDDRRLFAAAKKKAAAVGKAFSGAFGGLFGSPEGDDGTGEARAKVQALKALKEQERLQAVILSIRKKQRRVGVELLEDAKEQLVVDTRKLQDLFNDPQDGKTLPADGFLPAKAELNRVFFDSLRSIGFQKIGGFFGFPMRIVPVVDRSEITSELEKLRSAGPQTIEQEVAQQLRLNKAEEEQSFLRQFKLELSKDERVEFEALVKAKRAFRDEDARLEGQIEGRKQAKEALELQRDASETNEEFLRFQEQVLVVTQDIVGLETFRKAIADGLSVERAKELDDLARRAILVDDDLSKAERKLSVEREIAALRLKASQRGSFFGGGESIFGGQSDEAKASIKAERDALEAKGAETPQQLANLLAAFDAANRELGAFEKAFEGTGQQIEGAFVSNVDNAWGAFIDGTLSAKEAMKEFARAFIRDVLRMIAVRATLAAISGGASLIFGEDGGTVPGGLGTLKPFAKGGVQKGGFGNPLMLAGGGVIDQPSFAVIGEGKKNEAVVPLPDNRSIPVIFPNGGNGSGEPAGDINLYMTIPVSAIDTRDFADRMTEVAPLVGQIMRNQIVADPTLLRAMRSATRSR